MSYSLIISKAATHSMPFDEAELLELVDELHSTTTVKKPVVVPLPDDFSYTVDSALRLHDLGVDQELTDWITAQVAAAYPGQIVSEIAAAPDPQAKTLFSANVHNTRSFGTFWTEHPITQLQYKRCYQIVIEKITGVYHPLPVDDYRYVPPVSTPLPQPVYHTAIPLDESDTTDHGTRAAKHAVINRRV